jgi:5'-nucleotidase
MQYPASLPSSDRPLRILVSNDDGIDSPGIHALATALRAIGHVDVVAPNTQQSAVGHALTVALPLRAVPFERNGERFGWAVSGTPADAVKLAVKRLLPEPPDLVVSGINHGRNAAVSLIYSGTVSAATEGTLLGIPSIAISLDDFSNDADFTYAGKVAAWIAPRVLERGLPRGVLVNVNVPAIPESEIRGVRVVQQGESYWDDNYEVRRDPMGRPYYWLKGHNVILGPDDSDDHMITAGYVTITPVHYKLTDFPTLEAMRGWGLEGDSLPGSSPIDTRDSEEEEERE